MILEINKIIENDNDEISKVGQILYDRNIDDGLDKETTEHIIELLSKVEIEVSYTDKDLEQAYQEGYDEGYDVAKDTYECDCDCC